MWPCLHKNRMEITAMNARLKLLIVSCVLALAACQSAPSPSPLLSAEPGIGASLTRAPRTLRLFYSALPDVSKSNLRLVGPSGELALRGLHTMAADDLMIEILDEVTREVTRFTGPPPLVKTLHCTRVATNLATPRKQIRRPCQLTRHCGVVTCGPRLTSK